MPNEQDVSGKCVLIVEDDYLLARELSKSLRASGASVLGPAPTVHYARLMVGKRKIDGAVLDIQLFGEDVYDLVDTLMGKGIPIVFATAFDREQIADKYRSIDTLQKPISLERLHEKVAAFEPQPIPALRELDASIADRDRIIRGDGKRESVHDRWSALMVAAMRDDA